MGYPPVRMKVEPCLLNGPRGWCVVAHDGIHGKKYLYGYDGRTKLNDRVKRDNERLFLARSGRTEQEFIWE